MNLKLRNKLFAVATTIFVLAGISVFAGENAPKRVKRAEQQFDIKVRAWGPTQAEVDAAKARVEKSAPVQAALKNVKYRLMSLDYIETEANKPTRYRVIFYDYTNDRVFAAESDFAGREPVTLREEKYAEADAVFAPGVSSEELFDAFEMVKKDTELGSFYKQGKLQTYDAMPPVTMLDGERLVNIGITKNGVEQVVGISFKNNRVVYYENGAPPTSKAAPESCGIGNSGQVPTANGTPGQFQLSVFAAGQQQQPLWEMLVIRPAASSGNPSERSGIEIRDVKYKGKTVLKRGHVPVLNVEYEGDVCGPFRDWQYQEGPFDAPEAGAQDPAPGIRILAQGQIAKTALDSGIDQGNFRGVAVYQQNVGNGNGNELVMVSEMNAGWYRYIMEWRFAQDGTIRPRYGFGSTKNACVCSAHQHNAYWRFDFDIVNPTNKIFQVERGRKFLKPVTNETNVLRNYGTNRGFVIQNSTGDEAYSITASLSDGNADTFGIGDFWLLKYKGTAAEPEEIDDPNISSAARFSPWMDNESLVNQDVVVWYSAHFIHNDGASLLDPDRSGLVLSGSHVVGPVLRPIRW